MNGLSRLWQIEENTAADAVVLSPGQLQRLETLEAPAGDRHDQANMASIDR